MNKKYFAKYLPVEGEIKEGDLVTNNVAIWEHKNSDKHKYGTHKKVKLFLCSRDIQVGDKIQNIHDPLKYEWATARAKVEGHCLRHDFIAEWYDPEFSDNDEDNHFAAYSSNKDWFKVIGEISPDATWIRENDEFDKDHDVMPIIDKRITNFDSDMDWTEAEYEDYIKFYKIKGPCGHFH